MGQRTFLEDGMLCNAARALCACRVASRAGAGRRLSSGCAEKAREIKMQKGCGHALVLIKLWMLDDVMQARKGE